jgi:hypothetical protein
MDHDSIDFHVRSCGDSLIGIFSGLVVAYTLINARQLDRWTSVFLWTTALTSVTGFMFPFHGFKPSYVVGAISLIVLALAIFALYRQHLAGGWRTTYVINSMIALYLNVFVLVVQLFRRVPALKALAPTQTAPAFKITQLFVLLVFAAITVLATIKFRHAQLRTA